MALEFLKDRGDSLAPKTKRTFSRLTDFESKFSHDLGEMKDFIQLFLHNSTIDDCCSRKRHLKLVNHKQKDGLLTTTGVSSQQYNR